MGNKETLDASVYNKLIQNVHIESINLKDLSIKSSINKVEANDQPIVELKFQNDKFHFTKTNLSVNPRFILEVSKKKGDNKSIIFEIEFEYDIEYRVEGCEDISEDYIELFVKRNVPINVWPYARELISSMTTRMGYPALIIEPLKG